MDEDDTQTLVLAPPTKHVSKLSAQRLGQRAETPRGLLAAGEMEELTEEEIVDIELQKVKQDRAMLMTSIAATNAEVGSAGGEAQQNDIRYLQRELDLKKAKLNELKEEARRKDTSLAKMRDDQTDAKRMTPPELSEQAAYIEVRAHSSPDKAHTATVACAAWLRSNSTCPGKETARARVRACCGTAANGAHMHVSYVASPYLTTMHAAVLPGRSAFYSNPTC